MTAFDRDDMDIKDLRPEHGYPSYVGGNAPIWFGGIAVVGAIIIGVFAYESDYSDTHRAPVQTQQVSPAPVPTVIPAPEPPPAKP